MIITQFFANTLLRIAPTGLRQQSGRNLGDNHQQISLVKFSKIDIRRDSGPSAAADAKELRAGARTSFRATGLLP